MRVWEIAMVAGVESKRVKALLNTLGVPVKSASSMVKESPIFMESLIATLKR